MPRKKPPIKRKKSINRNQLLRIVFILGIALIAVFIVMVKDRDQPVVESAVVQETQDEKLDRLLEEGKPLFLFFHSNNCHSCIVMVETVKQVLPEFIDEVTLLDIDVYDEKNVSLLSRAGITTIPTQIFIDRSGQSQTVLGAMESETLRQYLSQIAEGN